MTQQKTVIETSSGGMVYRLTSRGRQWLLIQHSAAKHWSFPKGHIGDTIKDEKKEDAALREVEEEGGVRASIISHEPFPIHYYFKLPNALHKKTVYYYLMEYLSGDPAGHDAEIQDARFVDEDKVLEILTYKNDQEVFRTAQKKLNTL